MHEPESTTQCVGNTQTAICKVISVIPVTTKGNVQAVCTDKIHLSVNESSIEMQPSSEQCLVPQGSRAFNDQQRSSLATLKFLENKSVFRCFNCKENFSNWEKLDKHLCWIRCPLPECSILLKTVLQYYHHWHYYHETNGLAPAADVIELCPVQFSKKRDTLKYNFWKSFNGSHVVRQVPGESLNQNYAQEKRLQIAMQKKGNWSRANSRANLVQLEPSHSQKDEKHGNLANTDTHKTHLATRNVTAGARTNADFPSKKGMQETDQTFKQTELFHKTKNIPKAPVPLLQITNISDQRKLVILKIKGKEASGKRKSSSNESEHTNLEPKHAKVEMIEALHMVEYCAPQLPVHDAEKEYKTYESDIVVRVSGKENVSTMNCSSACPVTKSSNGTTGKWNETHNLLKPSSDDAKVSPKLGELAWEEMSPSKYLNLDHREYTSNQSTVEPEIEVQDDMVTPITLDMDSPIFELNTDKSQSEASIKLDHSYSMGRSHITDANQDVNTPLMDGIPKTFAELQNFFGMELKSHTNESIRCCDDSRGSLTAGNDLSDARFVDCFIKKISSKSDDVEIQSMQEIPEEKLSSNQQNDSKMKFNSKGRDETPTDELDDDSHCTICCALQHGSRKLPNANTKENVASYVEKFEDESQSEPTNQVAEKAAKPKKDPFNGIPVSGNDTEANDAYPDTVQNVPLDLVKKKTDEKKENNKAGKVKVYVSKAPRQVVIAGRPSLVEPSFKCNSCWVSCFGSLYDLVQHQRRNRMKVICPACLWFLNKESDYEKHWSMFHAGQPWATMWIACKPLTCHEIWLKDKIGAMLTSCQVVSSIGQPGIQPGVEDFDTWCPVAIREGICTQIGALLKSEILNMFCIMIQDIFKVITTNVVNVNDNEFTTSYHCPSCRLAYPTQELLIKHAKSSYFQISCPSCDGMFRNAEDYFKHHKDDHDTLAPDADVILCNPLACDLLWRIGNKSALKANCQSIGQIAGDIAPIVNMSEILNDYF